MNRFLLLLFFTPLFSFGQFTSIPDANFEQALIDLGHDDLIDGQVLTSNISGVDSLNIANLNILDLTGIGAFTAITYLDFSGQGITSPDPDLSQNSFLTTLKCGANSLTSLDLSQNTALTYLDCSGNDIANIDLSNNTALTHLIFIGVGNVSMGGVPINLDLTQNTSLNHLDCSGARLTSLDLSQNTALTYLNCAYTLLTTLDLSQNMALTYLNCSGIGYGTSSGTPLSSLDISQNTALTILACSENELTSLDVTQNIALTTLSCYSNALTSIDVSQNLALTLLSCSANQLNNLSVNQNLALTRVQCGNNLLTGLDLSQNNALTHLNCGNNQLTCLNVANGNNLNWALNPFFGTLELSTENNPNLNCIEVDDAAWSATNVTTIDPHTTFSEDCNNDCSLVGIEEYSSQPKILIRILDLLGRETNFKSNKPLIYQFKDGSTEKVFVVE